MCLNVGLRLLLSIIFFNGEYLIIMFFKCLTVIPCINLITWITSILLQNYLHYLKDPLEKGTVLWH